MSIFISMDSRCLYNGKSLYPDSQSLSDRHKTSYCFSAQYMQNCNNNTKMFNFLTIVCCIAAVSIIMIQAAPAPQKYTTKYDNVDIDNILNNDRLLNNYFKCLMETVKCTPEGEEIKREC